MTAAQAGDASHPGAMRSALLRLSTRIAESVDAWDGRPREVLVGARG